MFFELLSGPVKAHCIPHLYSINTLALIAVHEHVLFIHELFGTRQALEIQYYVRESSPYKVRLLPVVPMAADSLAAPVLTSFARSEYQCSEPTWVNLLMSPVCM